MEDSHPTGGNLPFHLHKLSEQPLTESILLEMFGDPSCNPMGWPSATLADLSVDIRLGTSQKSAAYGRPMLRIPNVKTGTLALSDVVRVPVTDREATRLQVLDGDLLFVRSNGNPDHVGRCAMFDAGHVRRSAWGESLNDFVFASYLIRVRLDRQLVEPAYVEASLASGPGRKQLREASRTSAGQFNINSAGLGGVRLAVPPLKYQQEFVRKRRAATSYRRRQAGHLAELDTLFASLQHRAFRGEL